MDNKLIGGCEIANFLLPIAKYVAYINVETLLTITIDENFLQLLSITFGLNKIRDLLIEEQFENE